MINYDDVARYFITKAYEDGREGQMTNMKLQKLLYYAQSLHLSLYDEPLFDAEIQAWKYGPVCPPAYQAYKTFKANSIPHDESSLLNIPDETKELLEEVWDYFGIHHAYTLSGMTHLEFPWKNARKGLGSQEHSQEPILLEDMKKLGYEKLDLIEQDNPIYAPVMTEVLQSSLSSSTKLQKGDVRDWLQSLLD